MTEIGKFLRDVQKALKYERQNNGGKADYDKTKDQIRSLFERTSTCPGDLPGSIFEYWENQYIFNSADQANEPTQDHVAKLGAFLAFLNNSDEDQDLVSDDDWQELGRLVGFESEDLPIEVLQDLMKILVSKGAY